VNILGVSGSIGWDGNISDFSRFWVHGSGATLIMDGELKNSMCEERFSRIKYDGNYPVLAIEKILDHNKLTKYDIDLVVYVGLFVRMCFELKQSGHTENKLQEYFPNSKVEFLSHHLAHSSATFYTSGFEEANVLTFDGAGDQELQPDGQWLVPLFKFSQGKDLTLTEIHSEYCGIPPMYGGLGTMYGFFSEFSFSNKIGVPKHISLLRWRQNRLDKDKETYPGKVMGLAAFGDYQKIDLPEWFSLEREKRHNLNIEWEDCFPQLQMHNVYIAPSEQYCEQIMELNPDDLAAWTQYQFEKYLLLLLSHIPTHMKRDNLCLGGGCALNILANTKIIEQGIYKNVHVNTAPNDDGLHFGAALYKSAEYENKITLPDDMGYLGIQYTDKDIEKALC
jgi:carbamoyltransferase